MEDEEGQGAAAGGAPCGQKRITPPEAEERAGMGASKNWKKSLLVTYGGEQMTLRKMLIQIGADEVAGGPLVAAPAGPLSDGGGAALCGGVFGATAGEATGAFPAFGAVGAEALAFFGTGGDMGAPWAGPIGLVTLGTLGDSDGGSDDVPGDGAGRGRSRGGAARGGPTSPGIGIVAAAAAGSSSCLVDIDGAGSQVVEILSRNGAFRGWLHLGEFLESREFGRAPGACIVEAPLTGMEEAAGQGRQRPASGGGGGGGGPSGPPEGKLLGRRMTPGDAEDLAGLGSNKNWKKSFM